MADSEDKSESSNSEVEEGRSDSEAEIDQSDASTATTEELCEKFAEWVTLLCQSDADPTTSNSEEQETTHGSKTPQQKRDSGVASQGKEKFPKNVKRELFPEQKNLGKWLESHPWEGKTPDSKEPMEKTVKASKVYTVSDNWLTNEEVDLEKIDLDLPKFIEEMRGLSTYQELENVLNSKLLELFRKPSPNVLEITQKHNKVLPKDKQSPRKQGKNNYFTAFSLPQNPSEEESYWFLDCEYMLKMHLPDDTLQWFKTEQEKRIRGTEKKEKRWIFTPSFRRAKIALLDWPQDDHNIVNQESTIRILVVRPSEFKEYVTFCGHKFPVICLPQDEIGAGYPRYWIQKIALRLELQFIWMIDDSVECFYEYHPDQEPPKRQDGKDKTVRDYTNYRRRQFGLVFERIEDFVHRADNAEESDESDEAEEKPIVAMSPRRWNPKCQPKKPFSCMPPQCAVYLNLRALSKKNVYYRPELKTFEDMIFGYECEKNDLKVYRDNRIALYDHNWKDTGASSPSVINQVNQ